MLRNQWSFPRWRKESRRLWANVFPAGEANFGQDMYRSLERSPQNTRDGFDLYNAQASLAWPRVTSAHRFSAFLDCILGVCQSLRYSFLYLGKLHWFLYLMLYYFYDPSMFISRWTSNFVEKVRLEREPAGQDVILCSLPCVILYREWIWTNYHETSLEN